MPTFDRTEGIVPFPFYGSVPSINVQIANDNITNPVIVKMQDKQMHNDKDVLIEDRNRRDDSASDLQIIKRILDSPTDPRGKFLRGLQLSASECVELDLYHFLESIPRRKRSKYGKRRNNQSEAERLEITKSRNREHAKATRDRRKVFIQIIEKSLLLSNRQILNGKVIDYLEKNQYDYKQILAKQSINTNTNANDAIATVTPSTTTATNATDNSPAHLPSAFLSEMDLQQDMDILSACIDTDFPFGDIDFDDLNHFFEDRDQDVLTPVSM